MTPPNIVAEIGCNHQGSLILAKKMIESAAQSGAVNYVKFQKREVRELLSSEEFSSPHPDPKHSFGESYGLHREALEFSVEQHAELFSHCAKFGVRYACSVWDISSARKIISLPVDYVKVPSACNLDFKLLDVICREFKGQIHVSMGMITGKEYQAIWDFLNERQVLGRTVFYACVSAYPAPAAQTCLLEIERLKRDGKGRIAALGFSGHHLGVVLDIAALALGAGWIERHFTLDKTWKGTDQSLALNIEELRDLRTKLDHTAAGLTLKGEDLPEIEVAVRKKLKRGV